MGLKLKHVEEKKKTLFNYIDGSSEVLLTSLLRDRMIIKSFGGNQTKEHENLYYCHITIRIYENLYYCHMGMGQYL